MRPPKLFACDVDGTLLRPGAHRPTPEAFELIKELQRRGTIFFAASGRQYESLYQLFEPIQDEIGYICENGCMAYMDGERLYQVLMEKPLRDELIKAVQATPGAEVLVSGKHESLVQTDDADYLHLMENLMKNSVVNVPDLLALDPECMKVALYQRGGLQDVEGWVERFRGRSTVVRGGPEWMDLMPPGISKAHGLQQVLDRLGFSKEDVMAVGDSENDVEMLQFVGHPIAVTNALPQVKAAAREEVDSVEELLRRLIAAWDEVDKSPENG